MAKAFVFPGQGSQAVGMGVELRDAFAAAREVFEDVDAVVLEQGRIDLQRLHLELAGQSHSDEAAPRLAAGLDRRKFLLHALELRLHFLGLAHKAEQILHDGLR